MELRTVSITRNDRGLGIKFDHNNVIAELVAGAAGALHGGIYIGDRLVAVAGRHVFAGAPLAPHFPPGDAPIELSFLRKAVTPALTPQKIAVPAPPSPDTCWRCRFEPQWRPGERSQASGVIPGRVNEVVKAEQPVAGEDVGTAEKATDGYGAVVAGEADIEVEAAAAGGVAEGGDTDEMPGWLLEAAEQLERLLPPTPSSVSDSPAPASPATPGTPTLRVDAGTSTATASSPASRAVGRPGSAVVQAAQLMDIAAAGLPVGWCIGWSATYRRAYFFHEARGLTQWDEPHPDLLLAPATTRGAAAAGSLAALQTLARRGEADPLAWREQQRLEDWAREAANARALREKQREAREALVAGRTPSASQEAALRRAREEGQAEGQARADALLRARRIWQQLDGVARAELEAKARRVLLAGN